MGVVQDVVAGPEAESGAAFADGAEGESAEEESDEELDEESDEVVFFINARCAEIAVSVLPRRVKADPHMANCALSVISFEIKTATEDINIVNSEAFIWVSFA